jgi:hypothetical protein
MLATCLAMWIMGDRTQYDKLMPRLEPVWKEAMPAIDRNPRVMLLRAINLSYSPVGNPKEGHALWLKAIEAFKTDRPEPLMPDWGDVESLAWLGGAHLFRREAKDALPLLERAVKVRPDFWWASKAALPLARRPIP